MRAAVYQAEREIRVEDVAAPVCGPDDVVVAVHACGICGSDLHAYEHGRYVEPGQVMGHEIAGVVDEVGDRVRDVVIGDRVAVLPYGSCGACAPCRAGRPNLCAQTVAGGIAYGLPGGFAERVRVPRARRGVNLFALADHVTADQGALAEPLAVAVHAAEQLGAATLDRVVVTGLGPIGLLTVAALATRDVREIVAVDVSAARLELATELGATGTALADGPDLRSLLDGRRADAVVECAGASGLVQEALRALRPGGTVVSVALYGRLAEINPSLVVQRELVLRGSFAATTADFATAVELINSPDFVAGGIVTHRFALAEAAEAFATAAARAGAVKVVVGPAA